MLEVEIMAKTTELLYSMFDAASTVAKGFDDYTRNEAQISTRNKTYQLQDAVNKELQNIQQSSNFENWNNDIAAFYERIKNGMSDKNSPYYCKNNLQAEQFQSVLDQSNIAVREKVAQMTIAAQNEKDILDTNNATDLIFQTYYGQEAYDRANEGYDLLFKKGAITRTQYEQQKDRNYLRAYGSMLENVFNGSFEESLKHGETPETFWQKMKGTLPELRATDASGMEKTFDITSYMDSQEKKYKAMYSARQQDMWNETEKKFAQIYDNVMDGTTAEARNAARLVGRSLLDNVKYTGKASPEQITTWTNRFKLEDAINGTGSKSSGQSAMNALKPEDKVKFVMNAIKRGDPHSVYSSYDYFQNSCMEELEKLNPDLSYTDLEKACPSIMEFFEEAKKHLPAEMESAVKYAENLVKTVGELKGDSKTDRKFYESEISSVMKLVFDSLYEYDLNSFDTKQREEFNKRMTVAINSRYGNILAKHKDYKEMLKDADDISAITDYEEGVIGNESKFAKALKTRDNNRDIMYTSMYYKQGDDPENFMGGKVEKGLKYIENEERDRLADAIEYRTGKKINPDEILSQYESEGTNDMNARKIYTINVDGTDYDFRFTSPDGKHVVMQEKKTGTKEWHESMQKKENKKFDVDTGIKDWKKTDKTQKPPISVQKPSASGGGEMTAEEWANMGDSFKINIIKRWIKEDPQKAREWINSISSK